MNAVPPKGSPDGVFVWTGIGSGETEFSNPSRPTSWSQCIALSRRSFLGTLERILLTCSEATARISFQRQHGAILDAIRRRDSEAAEDAVRTHIEAFRASVARHL